MASAFSGLLAGVAASSFLSGSALLQSVMFFCMKRKPDDPMEHKVIVGLLALLSLSHMVSTTHATYYGLVTVPGKILKELLAEKGLVLPLVPLSWSFQIQIPILVAVAAITKPLYVVRIWKLKVRTTRWIAFVMSLFLIVEYGLGTYLAYVLCTLKYVQDLLAVKVKKYLLTALAMAATSDIVVAVGLIYALVKCNPNLRWTDSNTNMLSAYVLNSGILPGFFSTVALIAYAKSSGNAANGTFLALEMVLIQVHINCFLAMINARRYFHSPNNRHVDTVVAPSTPQLKFAGALGSLSSSSTAALAAQSAMTIGSMGSTSTAALAAQSAMTINEVGLPLFRPVKNEEFAHLTASPEPVQIFVQTRRERSVSRFASG